ncbi:hypothetical protein GCM10020295_23170 [Streptomyces cinereospinus]
MGRHRRSAAGRAATGRAAGGNETPGSAVGGAHPQHSYPHGPPAPGIGPYADPQAYAEAVSRSDAYLFAPGRRPPPGRRRRLALRHRGPPGGRRLRPRRYPGRPRAPSR